MRALSPALLVSLQQKRHTALLVTIVAAFLVRPLCGESLATTIVFSIAMMALLLVALYATQVDELMGERQLLLTQRRHRSVAAWVLAVPAFAERLYTTFVPTHRMYVVTASTWLLFFGFVTWIQLRNLLKHKEVTSETIAMSVSTYLLLAIAWGALYTLIYALQPTAFDFGPAQPPAALPSERQNAIPIFIYFSLTTLSTIGLGDILPLSLQARYAVVAEGVTGQFYLAILVARLVGMHMSNPVRPSPEA
ncbi:MAG: potassium channel family protein [Candidatus Binatia bacterium]